MITGKSGTIYIVATPIGNLADMSQRAIDVLGDVDIVAAEDTRHSQRLLQHFAVKTPMLPLHEHNEAAQIPRLLRILSDGRSLALISDAGTPLISDPGYRLVLAAYEAGIKPVPVPGPSALSCMLSVAGQPVDRFVFEGFLPSRKSARQAHLQSLQQESRTLVFYESSHRVLHSVQDMYDVFGGMRSCTIGRELTKRYESLYRGSLSEVLQQMSQNPDATRGEFVIVVHGAEKSHDAVLQEGCRIMDVLLKELPVSRASGLAASLSGCRKKLLYDYGLSKQQG